MKKKRFFRRAAVLGLSAAMLFSTLPVSAASYLAPEGIQVDMVQEGGMYYDSNIFYPDTLPNTESEPAAAPARNALYPEKYDGRVLNQVSPVKFQNPWGACWAFAGASGMESSVMMQSGGAPDFSEKALAWYAAELQTGEGMDKALAEGKTYSSDDDNQAANAARYAMGGSLFDVSAQMSTGNAAATETAIPYDNAEKLPWESVNLGTQEKPNFVQYPSGEGDWTLQGQGLYDNAFTLDDFQAIYGNYIYFLNAQAPDSGIDYASLVQSDLLPKVKGMIMDTGSAFIGFHAPVSRPEDLEDPNSAYYNAEHDAQYDPTAQAMNHAVSIVGWDDNFPKENFNAANQPPADGAWIVKNSWSDQWGDAGYFYLSYYDTTVVYYATMTADVANTAGFLSHDKTHAYDYANVKSTNGLTVDQTIGAKAQQAGQEIKVANIFKAEDNETLYEVGVTIPNGLGINTTVETEIYRLPDNTSPVSGAPAAAQTDTVNSMLYSTITLDHPVTLEKGQYYSVVQRLTYIETGADAIPVETGLDSRMSVAGPAEGQSFEVTYKATAQPSESFVYGINALVNAGEAPAWKDITDPEMTAALTIPVNAESDEGEVVTIGNTTAGNVMIKAMTVASDTVAVVPEKAKVDLVCYDAQGNVVATFKDIDPAREIVLPDNAVRIACINEADTGVDAALVFVDTSGNETILKSGETLEVAKLDGASLSLRLAGSERGEDVTRDYALNIVRTEAPEPTPEPEPNPTVQEPQTTVTTADANVAAANTNTGIQAQSNVIWIVAVIAVVVVLLIVVMVRRRKN